MARHIAKVLAITSALLLTGGLISTSPYAKERDQSPTNRAPQQQQNFSNEDIQQFAKAAEQVGEINNAYLTKIQKAPNKILALQTEANKKMRAAILTTGLDIIAYNDIARTSSQDTYLARKVQKAQSS